MPDVVGTCISKVVSQSAVGLPGSAGRQLSLGLVSGLHSSRGSPWDGARLTYAGTADIVGDSGTQQGYFYNAHTDGAVSEGTFEARISAPDGVMTIEGTWTLTGGSGSLAGVKGGGAFKARMTSPSDSEMTWSGAYEV
jgi:hypothetical protein